MTVEFKAVNHFKNTDKSKIIREITFKTEKLINRRIQEKEANKKNA